MKYLLKLFRRRVFRSKEDYEEAVATLDQLSNLLERFNIKAPLIEEQANYLFKHEKLEPRLYSDVYHDTIHIALARVNDHDDYFSMYIDKKSKQVNLCFYNRSQEKELWTERRIKRLFYVLEKEKLK